MIEPRMVNLEDFPESTATTPGMRVMPAVASPCYSTVLLGIPYAEKSGQPLHLQVILPPPAASPGSTGVYPCVFYVQGSAWMQQNLGQELPGLADFARRGYVVVIIEYRPSVVAPFPAQVRDVGTAIRYVRDHAGEFHVDPERMALWGDSSGAHTTLMTYATQGEQEYSDEPVDDLRLRCFVDYYGPTNIAQMNEEPSTQDHRTPDSPEGLLIGGNPVLERPDLVAPTVIANHVSPEQKLQPLLMIHGSKDRLVPFAQSVELYRALRAAGQQVTFYQLQGADHGGPAFWQPAVLDLVDAFLKEHLQ